MTEPEKKKKGHGIAHVTRDARVVTHTPLCILQNLASRCSAANKYTCYPSYAQISEDTGYTRKTIREAIVHLVDKGLLIRQARVNGSNKYHLNFDLLLQLAVANRLADAEKRDRLRAAKKGATTSFRVSERRAAVLEPAVQAVRLFAPEHPCFADQISMNKLHIDLERAVCKLGSIEQFRTVANDAYVKLTDDELAEMASTPDLGNIVLTNLDNWVAWYETTKAPVNDNPTDTPQV